MQHAVSLLASLAVIPLAVPALTAAPAEKERGGAVERVEEPMGRGVVALPVREGVYVGWRLLRDDPSGVAFDVYRRIGDGEEVKVNAEPVRWTTDFLDTDVPAGELPTYTVRPARGGRAVSGSAKSAPRVAGAPHLSIRLQGEEVEFQKVGIADLDGDGAYDYVIKHPDRNIDPWIKYWRRSPETYRIEAYLKDSTFLWRRDLGWAIERGIWYSPWIAFDLTGDGKAEVAAKVGEGDPRDEDGRVTSGPEWVAVWDGLTGDQIARAPWPDRKDFPEYNRASRNQIAVAYLDGKTPALLALRGTYGRMRVDAYRLSGDRLELLWRYDNEGLGGEYQGQGAHFTLSADVDGDRRDEVVLGSMVLDDDGKPLWTTGKGHPDAAYLTDVDPRRAGLEIAYVMETRQKRGGLCLADAATGDLLWQLSEPTRHVHSKGLCADIDPTVPGMECYGADSESHKPTGRRWLVAADGTLLRSGEELDFGFKVPTAYWDGDLQKEIINGRIHDFDGAGALGRIEGRVRIVADVIGDWREEIITTVPGELRIYSTTLPAMDRRVSLMQDPIYRLATAMNAMGYTQEPTTSVCLEAVSPGLNLTLVREADEGDEEEEPSLSCRVVVSAPLDAGVAGEVRLESSAGVRLSPASFEVEVKPGGRTVRMVSVRGKPAAAGPGRIRGSLRLEDRTLRACSGIPQENPARP